MPERNAERERFSLDLPFWLNGTLDKESARWMEAYLAAHPECAAEYLFTRDLGELLQAEESPIPEAERLAGFRAKLQQRRRSPRWTSKLADWLRESAYISGYAPDALLPKAEPAALFNTLKSAPSAIQTIATLLASFGGQPSEDDGALVLPFPIEGEEATLRVSEQMDGLVINFELINLLSPSEVQQSKHASAFVGFLLAQNWQTAAGSCEMDRDGEVRVVLELPVADAQITESQLKLILALLANQAEAVIGEGRAILHDGLSDAGKTLLEQLQGATGRSDAEVIAQLAELAATPEGRSRLEAIASDEALPGRIRQLAQQVLGADGPDEL